MELWNLLRRRRAAAVFLMLVPMLGALGGWYVAQGKPPLHRTVVTVAVPSIYGGGTAAAMQQSLVAFSAAALAPAAVEQAAQASGIPSGTLNSGLSTANRGSNIVDVVLDLPQAEGGSEAASALAAAALDALIEPLGAVADEAVQVATERVTAAEAAMQDFLDERALHGGGLPIEDYRATNTELVQLRLRAIQADLEGDAAAAAGLRTRIRAQRETLTALSDGVRAHENLQRDRDSAQSLHQRVIDRQAEALALAAGRDLAVVGAATSRVPPLAATLRITGVAALSGLLLAVAMVAVREAMRREHPVDPDATAETPAPGGGQRVAHRAAPEASKA